MPDVIPTSQATAPMEAKPVSGSPAWAAQFAGYLQAARLTPDQEEAVLLQIEGASRQEMRERLRRDDYGIECLIAQANRRLARQIEDFYGPARRFPGQLLECIRNRRIPDDPEFPGRSEAEGPAVWDPELETWVGSNLCWHTARPMTADRALLRQGPRDTLRLLHQHHAGSAAP